MSSFSQKVKLAKRAEDKILLPRAREYMENGGSQFYVPDEFIPDLIRIAGSQENHIRTGRFGASSAGECRRSQVFKFLGVPGALDFIDSRLANVFLDGTWRHIRWQMVGLVQGWFSDVEVAYSLPELRLNGSMDAKLATGEGFELKGSSRMAGVIQYGPPEEHQQQIHRMFLAQPDINVFVYFVEDKASQELHEEVIERDPAIEKAVREELQDVNEAISSKTLPVVRPACRKQDGPTFRACQWRNICIDFEPETVSAAQWGEPVRLDGRAGRGKRRPARKSASSD